MHFSLLKNSENTRSSNDSKETIWSNKTVNNFHHNKKKKCIFLSIKSAEAASYHFKFWIFSVGTPQHVLQPQF